MALTVTSIRRITQAVWNLFGFISSLSSTRRFVSVFGTSIIWRSIVVSSSGIIGGEGLLVKPATWKLIVYDVDVGSYERRRPNHGT